VADLMAIFWDEKFEPTGYEETWSEGETVSGSGILDEDFATSSVTGAPGDWGTKCLRAFGDGAGAVLVGHDFASSKAVSYFRMEVIVKAFPTIGANFGVERIAFQQDSGSADVWIFSIQRRDSLSPNGFNWIWSGNDDGGGLNGYADAANDIALDTRYRLECEWDATGNAFEWRIDGTLVDSGVLTSTHPVNIQNNFRVGWQTGAASGEIFIDNVAFDDADWVGAVPSVGSPWYAYAQM
jgi:hypothetical protein